MTLLFRWSKIMKMFNVDKMELNRITSVINIKKHIMFDYSHHNYQQGNVCLLRRFDWQCNVWLYWPVIHHSPLETHISVCNTQQSSAFPRRSELNYSDAGATQHPLQSQAISDPRAIILTILLSVDPSVHLFRTAQGYLYHVI